LHLCLFDNNGNTCKKGFAVALLFGYGAFRVLLLFGRTLFYLVLNMPIAVDSATVERLNYVNLACNNPVEKEFEPMVGKSNVRGNISLNRCVKAISPVVATLLMIAIAVVASLVVYAFVTGYVGTTTNKTGNAIQIQSVATDPITGDLVLYVQNVGQGAVRITPDGSVYVNDAAQTLVGTETITISPGETVTLAVSNYPWVTGTEVKAKVVTDDGTSMEITSTESGIVRALIFTDGFESGDFSEWSQVQDGPSTSSSIRYSGTYSMQTSAAGAGTYKNLPRPLSTAYVKFYVYFTSLPTAGSDTMNIVYLYDSDYSNPVSAGIYVAPDGTQNWFLNSPSAGMSLNAQTIPLNAWISVEIGRTVGSGTGGASLSVDGNQIIQLATETIPTDAGILFIGSNAALTTYFDDAVVASG
jgi:archaeal type IV pilus assembly protein PilA